MTEQRFETGKTPQVTVSDCQGELAVQSWDGTAVLAAGEQVQGEETAVSHLTLRSDADLALTVPRNSTLKVENVHGPLSVKHVDGSITIGEARDTVTLGNVDSVGVTHVHGPLHAENVNGPLAIDEARDAVTLRRIGDCRLGQAHRRVDVRYVNGILHIDEVRGELAARTVSGDLSVPRAHQTVWLENLGGQNNVSAVGDIRLVGGLANGEHLLQSDGDILAAWPVEAPVTLAATARRIDNQLSLADAAETAAGEEQTTLTGHIENGKPVLTLRAEGNIGLKPLVGGEEPTLAPAEFDFSPPPPTLAQVVAAAVEESLAATAAGVDPELAESLAAHLTQRLVAEGVMLAPREPMETAVAPPSPGQKAAAQAIEETVASLQQAQDTMTQTRERLVKPPPETTAVPDTKPAPPPPEPGAKKEPGVAAIPVSPSQTQILRLLKDDLITIEQANLLLDQLRDS